MKQLKKDAIAVIGMSCRFSQIDNLEDFWNVLSEGKSVIEKISNDRWNHDELFDPNPDTPLKTNQDSGALLKDINHFDPYFFHVSPKEAIEMSPSQKLMMELAWESYENSSLTKDDFYGSKTGVYIGNIWADFEHLRKVRKSEINNFSAMGQSSNIIANRISYYFGLTGPSLVLDTGCSSSLVALMLAVQSLRDGSSNMCIAGGVNHLIDQDEYVYLSKFGGLSSKGKCSAFDADADGFVRGEGAGLVLLKRLEDAEKDGDKILGVIRGGAVTNNGFNVNMPATSRSGQVEVLTEAYEDAGVEPSDVDYIEAHGTGTKQGDPTETGALGEFFGANRSDDAALWVGSVKTNLGHCESSSGIAGVIKTVLALKNHTLPRNLNFNKPNPKIDFKTLKLRVPTENVVLEKANNGTLKAGVSSYGWGGTNVHIVFEEYKAKEVVEAKAVNPDSTFYLPLSAHSPKALIDYSQRYKAMLQQPSLFENLADFCAASAYRKTDFEYKKMFWGKTLEDITKQLDGFKGADQKAIKPVKGNKDKVVFVFPGQGAQWFGMGKELYENEPVFKQSIDKCDKAFSKYADWSLIEEIFATEEDSKLKNINVIQPYLFAMQVALSELWMSKGVQPSAVVGHSMGEVGAAYIAGALSIDDAANVICTRSILMNTLSGQGGAMAVTELSADEAEAIVNQYDGKISLAVQNSPKSTVLAGDNDIIQEILEDLTAKNLFCRQVKVDVASHSPQMDSIKDELFDRVKSVSPQKNELVIYSTVKNQIFDGLDMDADYWRSNLRGTVQFASVTEKLLNDGYEVFVEVSPHSVLSTAIKECAEHFNFNNVSVIGSLHRENPSMEEFATNFGLLYEAGYAVNWENIYGTQYNKNIELPAYPFQRENYEIEDLSSHFESGSDTVNSHPFLGSPIKLAESDVHYWESKLSLYSTPYLAHHQVNENAVFPGGFYVEMILSAIKQIDNDRIYSIEDLRFVQSIEIFNNEPVSIQVKIESEQGACTQFKVFKKVGDNQNWELTCFGALNAMTEATQKEYTELANVETTLDKSAVYSSFNNLGVTFKEYFQNVQEMAIAGDEVRAKVNLTDTSFYRKELFSASPILFDNCFHPLFAKAFSSVSDNTIKTTFVEGLESIRFCKEFNFEGEFYVAANLAPIVTEGNDNVFVIKGDIAVYDDNKDLLFELKGAQAKVIDTGIERAEDDEADGDIRMKVLNESDAKQRLAIINDYMLNLVAEAAKASPDQLDLSMTFKNMGIDSLTIVQLRNIIEKQFDIKISIKMFHEFPSIDAFSQILNELIISEDNIPMIDSTVNTKGWLIKQPLSGETKQQLFVFHDAGGSIRLFEPWTSVLDDSTELIMIQLPGRDNRTDETPVSDINELMDNLLPLMNEAIDKPFSIYGHSMGGLVAFEAARRLQYQYGHVAQELIVSGTPCLKGFVNEFVNNIFESQYTDEQWLSLLTSGNDTGLSLENDLVKEMLNTLRNDFKLIHNYQYEQGDKLKCTVTALHAIDDDRVNIEDVKKWPSETEKSFELFEVKGGHNFVYDTPEVAPQIVSERLARCLVEAEA
nr:polyketide synthase [uncultured Carboxylicivirga sp.]